MLILCLLRDLDRVPLQYCRTGQAAISGICPRFVYPLPNRSSHRIIHIDFAMSFFGSSTSSNAPPTAQATSSPATFSTSRSAGAVTNAQAGPSIKTPLKPVLGRGGYEFPAIWSFPPFFT